MSDAYDRLIEGRLKAVEDDVDAHRNQIAKLELWQRTVLAFVAGISFASGAFSKEAVEALRGLLGS